MSHRRAFSASATTASSVTATENQNSRFAVICSVWSPIHNQLTHNLTTTAINMRLSWVPLSRNVPSVVRGTWCSLSSLPRPRLALTVGTPHDKPRLHKPRATLARHTDHANNVASLARWSLLAAFGS